MVDDSISKKIQELKKRISTLEWDIPNIGNAVLANIKRKQLEDYKKDLGLLNSSNKEI